MLERITISFDLSKKEILDVFQDGRVAKRLEKFLGEYFLSFVDLHKQYITRSIAVRENKINDEKKKEMALQYVISCIDEKDLEQLKIEVYKRFFRESFSNMEPDKAMDKAFKAREVYTVAENIQKKLIYRYLFVSVL